MRAHLGLLVIGAALAAGSRPAAAQERGALYAIGGIALMHQSGPEDGASQTYVVAPGGRTRGWLVGAGIFVARALSVEVEASSTGLMTAREPSRHGMTFNEERRDRFLAVAARVHLPLMAGVRLEPVVGLILTRPEAWSQIDDETIGLTPPRIDRGPRMEHRLDSHTGITFGSDVRIGGRHVALLPTFRVSDTGVSHGYYAGSTDHREIEAIYPGGYPRWTVRAGAAVRVDF